MLVCMDADQIEVLGALKDAQAKIVQAERDQAEALTWRSKLVARGRELGLSQAQIAEHIGVRPNVLGQAALRERRRALAS